MSHRIVPSSAKADLPDAKASGASSLPSAQAWDRAYKLGFAAGLSRGIAESGINDALLDAYQRELAEVYEALASARLSVAQLRRVIRAKVAE